MAPKSATSSTAGSTDDLLESLVDGERGRPLRRQLAARNPDLEPDAIEEAIQYACKSFLDEAEGITTPGQVYAWIRTAATRSLSREIDRRRREVAVDPEEADRQASADGGPVEELIELEDDADLEMLVRPDGRRTTVVGDALVWALERIAKGADNGRRRRRR